MPNGSLEYCPEHRTIVAKRPEGNLRWCCEVATQAKRIEELGRVRGAAYRLMTIIGSLVDHLQPSYRDAWRELVDALAAQENP